MTLAHEGHDANCMTGSMDPGWMFRMCSGLLHLIYGQQHEEKVHSKLRKGHHKGKKFLQDTYKLTSGEICKDTLRL